VVVFCHHHDVSRALKAAFPSAALVTGETPMAQRMAEVDRFQTDPDCRLFIGGIQAAGVGLTLTAAQVVVFAELDWVPGNMTQAEDRLHRIGQRGSVLVQHLVFNDSVDAYMAQMVISKQGVIEQALDARGAPIPPPAAHPARDAVRSPQHGTTQAGLTPTRTARNAIPVDEEIPF
jgi:SWI/SNF-related matrix-associated actin-dependent regulator 1 of chromatin subfamily A